jgi:hypothetical protein
MNEQTKEAFAKAKAMRPITVKAQGAGRSMEEILPMVIAALRHGPAKRSDLLRSLRGMTAAQLDTAVAMLLAGGVLVSRAPSAGSLGRPTTVFALSDAGDAALRSA